MEKKDNKKEKSVARYAKGFRIASEVLYITACVACLVFIVLAIVLPLTCNFEKYSHAEVALIFGGLALYSFFMIGVLWNVLQIFVSIEKANSPFSERVTKYVKKTGIFVILVSVVPALVQGILVSIFAKDSDVNSVIQIGGVISGIILYLLGFIFNYGAELQEREDKTL